MIVKKCPYKSCNNSVRIHEIKFPVINDYGGIVIECNSCKKFSYVEIINPVETSLSKGGEKVDVWDNDVTTKEKFLEKYKGIPELEEGIIVNEDLEYRAYKFNYQSPHIYLCECCLREVETVSKLKLDSESAKISKTFDVLMNYVLANGRMERDDLIIEVDTECICKNKFTAYWHAEFISNPKPLNFEKLMLVGTSMTVIPDHIDAIMSKSDCITVLEKFIIRWHAIYPKLLVVTPFVGHQWLSSEEIIELWDWIKNFLNPAKATLVTRTATFNKYKKACAIKGINIEQLQDYGLNHQIIQDFTRKQDFHAKIYIGYSDTCAEIIMGSFNLMNGPSMENISFKRTSFESFKDRFILPLNISIDVPGKISPFWLHIYKRNGQWIAHDVEINSILKDI